MKLMKWEDFEVRTIFHSFSYIVSFRSIVPSQEHIIVFIAFSFYYRWI